MLFETDTLGCTDFRKEDKRALSGWIVRSEVRSGSGRKDPLSRRRVREEAVFSDVAEGRPEAVA